MKNATLLLQAPKILLIALLLCNALTAVGKNVFFSQLPPDPCDMLALISEAISKTVALYLPEKNR